MKTEFLMTLFGRRRFLAGLVAGSAVVKSLIWERAAQAAASVSGAISPRRGGTLTATLGFQEPQAMFVPAGGGSSPSFTSTKVLEHLISLEPDLSVTPILAEVVTPSSDFTSYTIKVRQGVTWHDGHAFSAEDVAFSIERYWKLISANTTLGTLKAAQIVAPDTVLVQFSVPFPQTIFLSLLAANVVIPKHIYATGDIVTHPANVAPIGTGPWKFKEWVRGSHVEFVRNDSYWASGQPYPDRLVIRWWREAASRAAALESGEIDIGVDNPVPWGDVKRLESTGKFDITQNGYAFSVFALTAEFSLRHPVLAKREVRQALLHAIDRQFIADTIYFGWARPAAGPVPTTNKLYFTRDVPQYDFDPAKARTLLDNAGFPIKADGHRFSVKLVVAGWLEENGQAGNYVKQALGDIGVAVTLQILDRPRAIKQIYGDYDFDIAISNGGAGLDPIPTSTLPFTTQGVLKGVMGRNNTGYANPEMDDLVARLTVETNPARRNELVQTFTRLALTDVPLVHLVEIPWFTVSRKDVRDHSYGADFVTASWGRVWLDR